MINGRPVAVALWHRRWTALLVLVVIAAATVAWLMLAPRRYTATAELTVTPRGPVAAPGQLEATVAELADSRAVLAPVAASLGHRRTVATLRREVVADRVGGTSLIRVYVTDRNRRFAARVADAVAQQLPQWDPSDGRLLFRRIGAAAVPSGVSSPDVPTAVTVAALVGVLLAVAAALWREQAVGTVDRPEQPEALGAPPVLAAVARPRDPGELPTDGPAARDVRALRVALEFATSDDPASVVVVAPAVADEAAAWTAVQLACALAQVEHRVLLVDADLGARTRHPMLKADGPGLVDVLHGRIDARDAVRPTEISGLSVLPAGKASGHSHADIVELRVHRVLTELHKDVDVVLVCAPALGDCDDARVMAAGNASLLIVPAGRMRARRLRALAAQLRRMRLRVIGTVLLRRRK